MNANAFDGTFAIHTEQMHKTKIVSLITTSQIFPPKMPDYLSLILHHHATPIHISRVCRHTLLYVRKHTGNIFSGSFLQPVPPAHLPDRCVWIQAYSEFYSQYRDIYPLSPHCLYLTETYPYGEAHLA